jgi:hypothetical protein
MAQVEAGATGDARARSALVLSLAKEAAKGGRRRGAGEAEDEVGEAEALLASENNPTSARAARRSISRLLRLDYRP